ncbi:MAG: hypothetical protein IJ751_07935 [Oscillospiraceae bacterium]|nr:hypothetical protein [Oscillospiraceae bacterium]
MILSGPEVRRHPELWPELEPYYYFYPAYELERRQGERDSYHYQARLVLESDDPGIFRRGSLADYGDVAVSALNAIALDTYRRERERAAAAWVLLPQRPEAVEQALILLRAEARSLFPRMEQAQGEAFDDLNRRFDALTDEEQKIRLAYSLQNPWLLNYALLQEPDFVSHAFVLKAVDRIIVTAEIIDPAWRANPVYPERRTYTRGMVKSRGTSQRGTQGSNRGRPPGTTSRVIYREPKLRFTGLEALPRFWEYGAYLPEAWFTKQSLRRYGPQGEEEIARWRTEAGETAFRSSRVRRKRR